MTRPNAPIPSSIAWLLAVAFLSLCVSADAQNDADGAAVAATIGVPSAAGAMKPGWRNQWGVGLIVNPSSVGGDDYNVTPIPYFDFRYFDQKGTKYFANVPQGLGGYFYRDRDTSSGRFLNIGASLAPGFNVRDDDIAGLEEVGVAAEARLLLETGGRRWAFNAQLAQDIGSGHEGAYLDLNLALRGQLGKSSGFYAVGPVLRVGDDAYKDAFYSISPAESAASGLAAYEAGADIERLGLQGLVSLPLGSSPWRFTSVARFNRLMGDATDSPLVVDDNQLFFIASVTRSF